MFLEREAQHAWEGDIRKLFREQKPQLSGGGSGGEQNTHVITFIRVREWGTQAKGMGDFIDTFSRCHWVDQPKNRKGTLW